MRRGLWWLLAVVVVAVGAVAVVFAVGPSMEQPGVLPPLGSATPSESAAVASPTLTEEEQVIDVYRRYQEALFVSREATASERPGILAKATTQEYQKVLLENIADQEAAARTLWGKPSTVLDYTVRIDGAAALIRACLDSSQGGQANSSTGEKLTVGPPRNPTEAHVLQTSTGWRVNDEIFPGGSC